MFTIILQQRRTLLFGHLCLKVQVHLKRRSSNRCFLFGFCFFLKGNLQSRVCNCSSNCYSVSIFPSASLDPLVTLIPLSPSHANSLESSVLFSPNCLHSVQPQCWYEAHLNSSPNWLYRCATCPHTSGHLKATFHGYQAQTREQLIACIQKE